MSKLLNDIFSGRRGRILTQLGSKVKEDAFLIYFKTYIGAQNTVGDRDIQSFLEECIPMQ